MQPVSVCHQVSTGGVYYALGFTGRTGGVEHVEGMFAIQWLCRALLTHPVGQLMPPVVASGFHLDL